MESSKKIKGITIAVTTFIALHYSLTIASNSIANNSETYLNILPFLNFIAFFLYVICGFIASLIVKKQNIFIGIITGSISATLAVVIFGVGSDVMGMLITIFSGFILGGIGGVLSIFFKGKVNNAL